MKNWKINPRVFAKITAYVLSGALATTALVGCEDAANNEDSLLKGTILEKTCVVTFDDGSRDIARIVGLCKIDNKVDYHYFSVISGEYYSDAKCSWVYQDNNYLHHYDIAKVDSIVGYLTDDDLKKALDDTLSNDDLIGIVRRVKDSVTEDTTQMVK